MPNWCANKLTVIGSPELLQQFRAKAQGESSQPFQIGHFLPMPAELEDTAVPNETPDAPELLAKYGYSDWHMWRSRNWGFTWEIHDGFLDSEAEQDGKLEYIYPSAWAPMLNETLAQISKQHPGLRLILEYAEQLMGYYGRTIAQDGRVEEMEEGEMTYSEEAQEFQTNEGIMLPEIFQELADSSG